MARSQHPPVPRTYIPPGGPLRVEEDHTRQLQDALDALSRIEILIGIPSDSDQPHYSESGQRAGQGSSEARQATEEGGIESNATLGYIHEHGSPINNIPPRPWLGPGVEGSRDRWLKYMRDAGQEALSLTNGNDQRMERNLLAAGQAAVSNVKRRIVSREIPQDLSPRTIAARRRRTPSRTATAQEDVTALVDTAQMLNSISFVIKRDGSGG